MIKEKIIFNSDVSENYTESDIIEGILDRDDAIKREDVTEDMIQREANFLAEDDYNIFSAELQALSDRQSNIFLVCGSLGLWNGRRPGYKVLKKLSDLLSVLGNYDYVKIYQKGRETLLTLAHHDGTHYMRLMQLSKAGDIKYRNSGEIEEIISDYEPIGKYWKNVKLHDIMFNS